MSIFARKTSIFYQIRRLAQAGAKRKQIAGSVGTAKGGQARLTYGGQALAHR